MKKILLLLFMSALMPMAAGAQTPTDDTFTVSDLIWDAGLRAYNFVVGFNGSRNYTAFNMDIELPVGINVLSSGGGFQVSLVKGSDPVYPYSQVYDPDEGEYKNTYSHTLSCSMPESNSLRVTCSSNKSEDFRKTSGSLFRVYVTIDEAAFTSSFSPKPIVKLSGLNLTANENNVAVKYVPADFACRPFTTGIPTERTLQVNVSADNKIGTLILPFDTELPDGLKAYNCNAADGDLLTLTSAESIEACKPYIVYAENGYSGNLSGTAELTDENNVTDIFADGYLTGVLTSTTVNTGYILQNQGSGPLFYDAEGVTFSLPAGRCYLTPASGNVKAFAFNFGDTDGIEEFQGTPLPNRGGAGGEALFDLSGRKIESPSRGIYIQGTRKVIVK